MMGDRQAAFRREYRAGIRGWYNGYVHIAVIYAIGLTAMWVYLQHIGDVRPWEWAIVPVTFVGCNIFEWFLPNKRREWRDYKTHVSQFEIDRYLGTL